MIEGHILPAAGIVTRCAVRAELSAVFIFGSMTGIAIRWSAFEDIVLVTGSALHRSV